MIDDETGASVFDVKRENAQKRSLLLDSKRSATSVIVPKLSGLHCFVKYTQQETSTGVQIEGIGSGFVGQETSLPSPEQSMTIASAGDTKRVNARTHIVEFCYSYRVEFHHFAKEKS